MPEETIHDFLGQPAPTNNEETIYEFMGTSPTIPQQMGKEETIVDFLSAPINQGADDDGFFKVFSDSVIKGSLNIARGAVGTAKSFSPIFGDYGLAGALEKMGHEGLSEYTGEMLENIKSAEEKFVPNPDNWLEWGASVLGQALPYIATTLATGGFGGKIAAASVAFTVEGQNAYDDAKDRGASEAVAQTERVIVGSLNAVIEAFQIGELLKFKEGTKHSLKAMIEIAKKKGLKAIGTEAGKLGKEVLKNSINEAIQEFIQEGVSVGVPALPFLEGKEALPQTPEGNVDWWAIGERLGGAALAGGVVSPMVGIGGAIVSDQGSLLRPSDESISAAVTRIQNSKLSNAEKNNIIKSLEEMKETPGEVSYTELQKLADKMTSSMKEIEDIRPLEAEEMSKERGRRFNEVKDILADLTIKDPSVKFHIALGSMKGTLKQQIKPFLEDSFTQDDMNLVLNSIAESSQLEGEKFSAWEAIDKMFNKGIIPAKHEIKALEPVLGKDFTEAALAVQKKAQGLGSRITDEALHALNLPRAVLASYDLSAALRQGALVLFTDPKAWAKGVGSMYRAFMNKDYTDFVDMNIKTNKFYSLLQKSGLELTKIGGGVEAEEAFFSNFAERIPGIGRSERAYTTGLNVMRAQAFYNICEDWAGTGKTLQDYKDVGAMLNHLTGRGTLGKKTMGKLEKYAPILNAAFFSPRLQVARVQTVTDLFTAGNPTRRILAGTLVKALGTGLGILALIKLAYKDDKDVDVEFDPRSSDFGKIRIGNTRIDYWGGYSQMMRLVANLSTGKAKSTGTGRVYDQERSKTVLRYLQTKLSPPAGFTVDALRGENFMGEEIDWTEQEDLEKQLYERFTPLFIQDVVDALRYQGTGAAAIVSPLAFHGVGAQTYPVSSSTEAHKVKDTLAKQYFGDKWDNLGADAQSALRENFPLIELSEAKARQDRMDKKASARFMEEAKKSEKKLRKALKPEIVKQLDLHLVNVGGLSRQISSDWNLNDKRYKQYHQQTILILNQVLPEIIKLDVPPTAKRELLNETIKRVKKKIRENLVNEGNINDLQRMSK